MSVFIFQIWYIQIQYENPTGGAISSVWGNRVTVPLQIHLYDLDKCAGQSLVQ